MYLSEQQRLMGGFERPSTPTASPQPAVATIAATVATANVTVQQGNVPHRDAERPIGHLDCIKGGNQPVYSSEQQRLMAKHQGSASASAASGALSAHQSFYDPPRLQPLPSAAASGASPDDYYTAEEGDLEDLSDFW